MLMFSACSGPCETCKTHFTGGCLAGHGDDEYDHASPGWVAAAEKQFEEENRCDYDQGI